VSQTRTSSLRAARPFPPSADIGPGGQSVGQAAQFGSKVQSVDMRMRLGMRCRRIPTHGRAVAHVRGSFVPILLQKSFCEVGLKFSDP
jgi:hypothetical protein